MTMIKSGAKIRNARMKDVVGTLGCLVCGRADPGKIYVLSAAHVIGLNGYAEPGDAIEAESPAGSDNWIKIAEFERAWPWRHADGVLQVCDAALARVTDLQAVSAEIDGIGLIGSVATGLYEGMKLQFRGAGTGAVAPAKLYAFDAAVKTVYQDLQTGETFELSYANQITYVRDDTSLLGPTRPNDSGALIVDMDNFAIGLHFARTPDDYPVRASVCTPLNTVLDALQVDLVQPPAAPGVPVAPALPGPDAIGIRGFEEFNVLLRAHLEPHSRFGGIAWRLSADGLIVGNRLERSGGELVTVPRVWRLYAASILEAASKYRVPVELIVATICTESGGDATALRREPGWVSDSDTPKKVSVGLMQTLIATAREALHDTTIDGARLLEPATSIFAGTAYIAQQKVTTQFDPPLVACAYNAGGIYINESSANRWRIKQYPIGGSEHADRFVQWFNDCFAFLAANRSLLPQQAVSFIQLLRP